METQHIPPASRDYLRHMDHLAATEPPLAIATRVAALVAEQEHWRRRRCLDLLASDNVLSPGATRLLACDLATRVSEGYPGAKDFPPAPANRFVEEIEGLLIAQLQRFYRVPYVEWRLPSNSLANAVALCAVTRPGDTVLVQSLGSGGGNMGYQADGLPRLRDLKVVPIPSVPLFDVDIARLADLAHATRPKAIVIGGSKVLFPYPVREIRRIADDCGATVVYDAAHVGLLIATGRFQDALHEGAHVMTAGTHKAAGGPIGGLILTRDGDMARAVADLTYPGLVQTRDANKFAAAAYALAELAQFGVAYADAMVANARALAAALEAAGLAVLGAERGFTMTHQVFIDLHPADAREIAQRLVAAGILLSSTPLPGSTDDDPQHGLRLSAQEVTRRGMGPAAMLEVAKLIAGVVLHGWAVDAVAQRVEAFMADFPGVTFCFGA